MMASEKFCLRWNDFESNISSAFRDIRQEKEFFDVTVACDEEQMQAHKVILSACSPFFKTVLRRNQHQHPLLYLRGVSFKDLEAVLNFMYHGEVNVAQDDLNSFLQVAEDLKVKGLTQNNSGSDKKGTDNIPNNKTSFLKSEPRTEPPHPHPSEQDISHSSKRSRPTPPSTAPRSTYQQPPTQESDDIEVIVPAVKSEPRDTVHSAQTNNQNMVQQEQAMAMYDMSQQQESIAEQYDDSYGVDYDGQYVDQGYGAGGTNQGGGQDASGTGLPSTHDQCPYCYKSIHKATLRRHIKNQHENAGSVKCNFCDGIFKNESSMKDHQRQKHNVYQSLPI